MIRSIGSIVLLSAVLLTPVPSGAGVRAPLESQGELRFLADMPVFWTADDRARVDLSVRVDHAELSGNAQGRWRRDVEVRFKLARQGLVAVDTTQVFAVVGDVGDDTPGTVRFDLLEISSRVAPGRWAATVDVRTRGTEVREGRASGTLDAAEWPDDVPRLSDPEFRIAAGAGSLPHPERLYGVAQDTLETYVEIRGGAGQDLGVQVEVVDLEFGLMDVQEVRLRPTDALSAALIRVPLLTLPDGNYVLRLRPDWVENAAIEADFVVSWEIERALQVRSDVAMEAQLVLPPDEFGRFQRMSRPMQIEALRQFWAERDPTPGTDRNEVYDRFLSRVAHAARFYGEYRQPGPLTDRGKIYVLYGPPAQTQVEVVPSSGDELRDAIAQVHDTFAVDFTGSNVRRTVVQGQGEGDRRVDRVGVAASGDGTVTFDDEAARDLRRNAARINQEASFELWSYQSIGDPLFENSTVWGENIDLRFLFVDRDGIGSYRLEYSNVSTHH